MSDRRPFFPRRMQQQQEQQQQQGPQVPVSLPGLPAVPQNLADLKQLLQVYGPLLSPENRGLIAELVASLEAGGDLSSLQELAARMRQAAERKPGE